MTWRWTSILTIAIFIMPVHAEGFVSVNDTGYVPPNVIFIHGMAADPTSWKQTAAAFQPLVQDGTIDAPSLAFRYQLPPIAITSVQSKEDPGSWDTSGIHIDSSYFQYVHFGKHGNLEEIPVSFQDPSMGMLNDAGDAITQIAERQEAADDLHTVLETIDAALRLQALMGVGPENRSVIIVAHSTGGLATRVFLKEHGDVLCSLAGNRPYRDVIRHVVFLGVPHLGSPFANYLRFHQHVVSSYETLANNVMNSAPIRYEVSIASGSASSPPITLNPGDAQWSDPEPTRIREDAAFKIRQLERQSELLEMALAANGIKIDSPIMSMLSVPVGTRFYERVTPETITYVGIVKAETWSLEPASILLESQFDTEIYPLRAMGLVDIENYENPVAPQDARSIPKSFSTIAGHSDHWPLIPNLDNASSYLDALIGKLGGDLVSGKIGSDILPNVMIQAYQNIESWDPMLSLIPAFSRYDFLRPDLINVFVTKSLGYLAVSRWVIAALHPGSSIRNASELEDYRG